MQYGRSVFPIAAVVGQARAKKALLLAVINPHAGGVLLCGEKGTAKSTLVRGLPEAGGPGVVTLPLSVTEDRLLGTIDLERAVREGAVAPEPGLLAQADGGLLYADEINLLGGNIARALLDAAASGTCQVEREGLSCRFDARFILIGSMNPEEGALSPQLLDRFGLYVDVAGEKDPKRRAEIIRRRLAFEANPSAFLDAWRVETQKIADAVNRAKDVLGRIRVPDGAVALASDISKTAGCRGHRAELSMIEAAKAAAALAGRPAVTAGDVLEAASYALPHRARRSSASEPERPSPDDAGAGKQPKTQKSAVSAPDDAEEGAAPRYDEAEIGEPGTAGQADERASSTQKNFWSTRPAEIVASVGPVYDIPGWLNALNNGDGDSSRGRRDRVSPAGNRGRYVRSTLPKSGETPDIALDATLRAAAPYQPYRDKGGLSVSVRPGDLRVKVREHRASPTILFVVDASGSMNANRQMAAVKGAVLSLLGDAYRRRCGVAMIAFRKHGAELLLDVTKSVELAERRLAVLPTGGVTPLAEGLDRAYAFIRTARFKDKSFRPVVVFVTDGKATFSKNGLDPFEDALRSARRFADGHIQTLVIDTDQSRLVHLKMAQRLSEVLRAPCVKLSELESGELEKSVRSALSGPAFS